MKVSYGILPVNRPLFFIIVILIIVGALKLVADARYVDPNSKILELKRHKAAISLSNDLQSSIRKYNKMSIPPINGMMQNGYLSSPASSLAGTHRASIEAVATPEGPKDDSPPK